MKEEIDWKKEILASGRFNNKFSRNLLENGAKNFIQGIYLGYMYSRFRKIIGLDKDDKQEIYIYLENRLYVPQIEVAKQYRIPITPNF